MWAADTSVAVPPLGRAHPGGATAHGGVVPSSDNAPAMPTEPALFLASQSPRRRQLLEQLGVETIPLLPQAHEDAEALESIQPGELPADYVVRVTALKLDSARARWARLNLPTRPILTADTTVCTGRRILGKPADADEAVSMLRSLSGRTHRVLTAVSVWTGRRRLSALSLSRVRVARLTDAAIRHYVASGEPFGKAGAYAIQGAFAAWVEHIDGSHSGIMGLPLFETAELLRRAGLPVGLPARQAPSR